MDKDINNKFLEFLKVRLIISVVISVVFVIFCVLGMALKDWFGSDTFNLSIIPFLIIMVYCFSAFINIYLQRKAGIEEEDRLLLEKQKQRKRAFDSDEDILFTAERTLKNYNKFAPYFISIICFIVIGTALFLFWRYWDLTPDMAVSEKPAQASFIAAIIAFISFFFGVFCVGQSREKGFRWLRPMGIWLILFTGFMVASICAILFKQSKVPQWDFYLSRSLFLVLGILGVELLINFIIEFYRPRTGVEDRPVFESRLLSIITEPGGILRNLADTLDYQFGFKVSGTWIYRFLEKSISPLILIWLSLFWISTSFDEVPPGYLGVRETLGERGDSALDSGFYLKLPWPLQSIRKFPVDKIQEIDIGPEIESKKSENFNTDVVLWIESHYSKENPFLIAVDQKKDKENQDVKDGENKTVSVALISALVPIQFKINPEKIFDYGYKHKDPIKTFRYIAEKEVAAYFANTDLMKVMSVGRKSASNIIKEKLEEEVDKSQLGIDIVAVSLLDAHPPILMPEDKNGQVPDGTGVPEAFQDVIGAKEKRETMILNAKTYQFSTIPKAESREYEIISKANAYKESKIEVSKAEMERFKKRIAGYEGNPELYKLNEKMKFLENDCKNLRKYIVPASSKNDVYVINLEETRRWDLLSPGDLKDDTVKPKKTE